MTPPQITKEKLITAEQNARLLMHTLTEVHRIADPMTALALWPVLQGAVNTLAQIQALNEARKASGLNT